MIFKNYLDTLLIMKPFYLLITKIKFYNLKQHALGLSCTEMTSYLEFLFLCNWQTAADLHIDGTVETRTIVHSNMLHTCHQRVTDLWKPDLMTTLERPFKTSEKQRCFVIAFRCGLPSKYWTYLVSKIWQNRATPCHLQFQCSTSLLNMMCCRDVQLFVWLILFSEYRQSSLQWTIGLFTSSFSCSLGSG